MSETILGGSRFDRLYDKAYFAKNSLDRRSCYFDKEMAIDDYKAFLEEKAKNPTRANAAMNKVIEKQGLNYPEIACKHLKMLEKEPQIDCLLKTIQEKEQQLYPNSGKLRSCLFNNNRIALDFVTPKLPKFQKIILTLKSFL